MTAPHNVRRFLLALAGLVALLTPVVLPIPSAGAGSSQEQQPVIPATTRGTKLILKDGSFHLVRSYERKGDRVRYYSVERSAWEEIPAALVDWEATRQAEEAESQKEQELLEKARATETAAIAAGIDVDASIEYAPGHFLPEAEGFYAVDGATIVALTSVGADVKLDKGRLLTQILVPIPVIPSRHRVRIAGKKASTRLTTGQPEFYYRTGDSEASRPEPEIELLRAQAKGNAREIQVVETNIVGDQRRRGKVVSTQRWKVARGVYRFTLGEPLPPGEYAVAEYLPGEGTNFYLWDFGVDPPPAPAATAPK